jgi:hypothetical protein
MESPDEQTFDFTTVPHVAGVPRYMFRSAVEHLTGAVRDTLAGRAAEAFEHELWLCFFAGVLRQRWADRQMPIGAAALADPTT